MQLEKWNFQSQPQPPWREEGPAAEFSPKANDIVNHTNTVKTPLETLTNGI